MSVDLNQQLAQLRDFLKTYQRVTQVCFMDCVKDLSSRELSQAENTCQSNALVEFDAVKIIKKQATRKLSQNEIKNKLKSRYHQKVAPLSSPECVNIRRQAMALWCAFFVLFPSYLNYIFSHYLSNFIRGQPCTSAQLQIQLTIGKGDGRIIFSSFVTVQKVLN